MKLLALALLLALGIPGCQQLTPSATTTIPVIEDQLAIVNAYREVKKLAPLKLSSQLQATAWSQAQWMADNEDIQHGRGWFSFSTVGTRAFGEGYDYVFIAENIAAGERFDTFQKVFNGWTNSRGHRENIEAHEAREIGIARVFKQHGKYKNYWVMVLGSR
jgi:uncharacterized protein YkwD